MFRPRYSLTHTILNSLTAVAEAKAVIHRAKVLPKHELRLRRQALVRMTHSSTAIEGNMLTLDQVEALVDKRKVDAPAREIYEVKNYLKTLRYIEKVGETPKPITEKVILNIHKLVTHSTLPSDQSGRYRRGSVYVVRRRAGFPNQVLYTGPDAKIVPRLVAELIEWIRKSVDVNPIIVAGITHLEIAAIHPFSDGNGRTARALATLVLYQRAYDFRHLFALEDYYNEDRPAYYQAINVGENYAQRKTDCTPWLEYFVQGVEQEIQNVKQHVIALSTQRLGKKLREQVFLDEDQLAVVDFIQHMEKATVNEVMKILDCPRRTAQLHLQKLKKLRMIRQVGKGPSSAYVLR